MSTKTSERSSSSELNFRKEFCALNLTLVQADQSFQLSPLSISNNQITADIAPNANIEDGSTGELTFRLQDSAWSCTAHMSKNSDAKLVLSLDNHQRPEPDSRISKRWKTSSFHPVSARIRNDLAAGQWLHCAVEDISIGGAKLLLTKDCEFFNGQRAKVEIDFPLQKARSRQNCEVTNVLSNKEKLELHVRFTPITDTHIQAIAKHLIHFEWDHPVSELELDLSQTEWPAHRITISKESENNKVILRASILGETLSTLSAVISGNTASIDKLHLDSRWSRTEQLNSILPSLIEAVAKDNETIKLVGEGIKNWPPELNFGEMNTEQWLERLKHGIAHASHEDKGRGVKETVIDQVKGLVKASKRKHENISWDAYGLVYDKMCAVNSSYQALTEHYHSWLKTKELEVAKAVDVGAGTGNFVVKTAEAFPNADIVHVDQDIIMNLFAQEKYKSHQANNVRIATSSIEKATFEESSIDLITAVHSLYTLADPNTAINKIYTWLKKGGYFYVIDIGRTIDTNEWSKHIFLDTAKTKGILSTAMYFWDARAAISQNKKIQATQDSGKYWTKEHSEFRSVLENAGFKIEESAVTYRGNSDLFVCRKP